MKTNNFFNEFILKFPKKEEDPKGWFKKNVLNRIWENYPWLTDDATSTSPFVTRPVIDISYAGPKDGLHFGKKQSLYDVNYSSEEYMNSLRNKYTYDVPVIDLYTEYNKAIQKVDQYALLKKLEKFDLMLGDNTVRFFDGYFQIGGSVIPYEADLYFFDQMSKKTRDNLTIVIVFLNNL